MNDDTVHSEVEDNTSLPKYPKGDLHEEMESEDIPPATTLSLQSTKHPLDVGAGDSGNHYEAADQDDIAPPTKCPKPTKKVQIKIESIAGSDTDKAASKNNGQGKEQSAQCRKGGQPCSSGHGHGCGKGNSSTKAPQEEQEKQAELAPGCGHGNGQGAVQGMSQKGKGKASIDIPEQSEQEEQADQASASKPAPRLTRHSVAVAVVTKAIATSLATSLVCCFDYIFTAGLH